MDAAVGNTGRFSRSAKGLVPRLRFASLLAGAAVAALGGIGLLGWALDIPALKSLHPAWVAMKANTALALVLAGLSVCLQNAESPRRAVRRLARLSALAVTLTGVVTLGEYLSGCDLGVDQLLFREPAGAVLTFHPGRMASPTALCFTLVGGALVLLSFEARRGQRFAQYLALAVGGIGFALLLGYVYSASGTQVPGAHSTPMAAHTALALVLVSAAVLCARPERGLMVMVTADHAGGAVARPLLVATVAIPVLFGWLRLKGQQAGLFGNETGVTLSILFTIAVLWLVVWAAARVVARQDLARQRATRDRDRLFNLSVDLLAIVGFDGRFRELNPSWEKTLGWTREELLAGPHLEFVHPDDRAATVQAAARLSEGHPVRDLDSRYRCRDGTYKWLSWTSFPLVDERLIFAMARDIGERKRAERQVRALNAELRQEAAHLETANKELEAFSYSVSHDLRAPLRHIGGFVQLLEAHAEGSLDAKGKHYLNVIADASRQMGHLIDDLLAFSRMGRAELHTARVDLTQLAREVIQEMERETQGRVIAWVVAELPQVSGDRAMLRLALANLLGNAVKYTRPRPQARIEVGSFRQDGETVVFVRDNGVGFDMQYVGKLFGVFQRLHSSDEFEGTGIGLANVRRIVHRHGGRTWAEGAVDQGATFYLSLPDRQEEVHA